MTLRAFVISALAALAIAAPMPVERAQVLDLLNANDLENGICKPVTLIFARGSIELGNMGVIAGMPTCDDLKKNLGTENVACQGVGGAYTAHLIPNLFPENTSPQAIGEAVKMFKLAATKCPKTQIVAGGYSQGTAVIDNAIQELDNTLKSQVKGVVLFGFTRNLQDSGRIPGYPPSQTKVICAPGDLVCDGTLIITPAHLTYGLYADDAAKFLASKVSI
ncbi:hypothetical protein P175DRAFT_0448818, partial [Aspergillus ochraceoroseus IBT 24754]|uniref:Cutinase n=3 Tax=Aspergillus subgen. Nidulantes TaxID=2720870 RepID=A0A0F8UNJ0_9EURO